jgi:hypothetical protein
VSLLDRSAPPHDLQDAIQEGLTTGCIDVERIELVMIVSFSASS